MFITAFSDIVGMRNRDRKIRVVYCPFKILQSVVAYFEAALIPDFDSERIVLESIGNDPRNWKRFD
ncbi:hypothetical protein L284_13745 [Novosphingobium lindaniclasticum LE124]|uniref:Uncharacterized protein n=1 Tax=Novosphingobium lindaniclasticum LE124 TaxID=1096930 RepID=T0IW09_9SPHN|nr:hypothetical protein L284_13745 [Novosphingobium lindaniclasticum LE124]